MNLVYFPCISICGPVHEIILMLAKERKYAFAPYVSTKVIFLTIIPRARMGSKSIAHEPEGPMGYWLRGHVGERNNCFSKI